jgi:ketosteroid isomerase-like protein
MIRHGLILALAGSLALMSAAEARGSRNPAPADAKSQVRALLRDWARAEDRHDAAALDRILDDKFLSTYGAGKPTDKAAFIKSLTKGKADPGQTQSLTDETVTVDGDTAILLGTDRFHRTDGAAPDGMAFRYTITCVRRNGRWVALAEHIVKMPK